jgi:hypothetical protein
VEKPGTEAYGYDATYAQPRGRPRIAKNTYRSAQFRRLAARQGKKRASVDVAHTILVIVFHMLKHQPPYRDLGADYSTDLTPTN